MDTTGFTSVAAEIAVVTWSGGMVIGLSVTDGAKVSDRADGAVKVGSVTESVGAVAAPVNGSLGFMSTRDSMTKSVPDRGTPGVTSVDVPYQTAVPVTPFNVSCAWTVGGTAT